MLKGFKRSLCFFVSVLMIATAIPFSAFAEADILVETYSEQYIPNGDDIPDNDELFMMYAQNEFDSEIYGDIAMFGSIAGDRLSDGSIMKNIYNEIKTEIAFIAKGSSSSSAISISNSTISPLKWTEEELGTPIIVNGTMSIEAQEKLKDKFSEEVDTEKIWNALIADHPYEFYWFDKTIGVRTSYSISYAPAYGTNPAYAAITALTIGFAVATDYRGAGEYVLNTTKTSATASAITNAKAIVAENAAKADIDKLTAYKEKICELVSYDNTAAGSASTTVGINPWQLIYVFDGDSTTNVVCEGYSKAFQYLCDLSTFNESVYCYSVNGWMNGAKHMWNVIEIGENRYLADITNCDDGTIGAPDALFLVVGESYSNAKIHYITLKYNSIEYDYDPSQKNLYCDGYLELKEILPITELIFENNGFDIPNSTVGTSITPIDVSVGVSGGISPYLFSATSLPDGISINSSSGIISGTPITENSEVSTATITVTDANGEKESIIINIGAIQSIHICDFKQKIPSAEFFISGPTCTKGTSYISSCICGNPGGELFNTDDALGHNYTQANEDNAYLKTAATTCISYNTYWYGCSRCNAIAKDDPEASDRFFVSSKRGVHIFNEKIADSAHFVLGTGDKCTTHKMYYFDCAYCNVIGNTSWESEETGEHALSEEWYFENDTHYQKCLVDGCNFKSTPNNCYGGTASCELKASCDVCHNFYGEFAPHNLKFIQSTAATCTEDGKKEHYSCDCGKIFEDNAGTTEISDKNDILISATGHTFEHLNFDDLVHWNECECGEIDEAEVHIDEDLDGKCDVCEMEISELTYIIGDADNNGIIEADDYILLKRIYFGTAKIEVQDNPETFLTRADINNSGDIDADDYIYLKRIFFGTYKIA